MHCEYLYPPRVIASSFNRWPATQIFPGRDPRSSSWTICVLLCPQNLNNLRRTHNSLLIPDPEWSPIVHIRIICSLRIYELFTSHWQFVTAIEKDIRTGLKIIYTESKILIPDPKSFGSSNSSKDFIHMCLLCCQVAFINLFCDGSESGTDPSDWLIS